MLGKLFRYEWKSTWKIPVILLVCMFGMTLIGSFSFSALPDIVDNTGNGPMAAVGLTINGMAVFGSLMLYLASIMAATFGIMLYMAIRFYKNLYTDEGYLMHTLPVTPRQLIWSKGLVFFLWTLIVMASMYVSVFLLVGSILLRTGEISWSEFWQALPDIWNSLFDNFQINPFLYALSLLLLMVISLLQNIFLIYAAISLGQTAKKFKVMASIGCYAGLQIGTGILSNIVLALGGFYKANSFFSLVNAHAENGADLLLHSYLPTAILSLILGALFYCITEFMMSRHLNLE